MATIKVGTTLGVPTGTGTIIIQNLTGYDLDCKATEAGLVIEIIPLAGISAAVTRDVTQEAKPNHA